MAPHIGRLTALFVKKHNTPGLFGDGGNLYLQITNANARSWIFRYGNRYAGLGSAFNVTLEEARDLAYECRKLLREGVDPLEVKRTKQAQARLEAAKAISFRQCAAAYIEAHRAAWKDRKHLQQWQNTIEQHCGPINDLPVASVDTEGVLAALQPIWTITPETASRLRGRIEAILDWAKVHGYRTGENPARWRGHLDKLLPRKSKVRKVAHHAAMPYGEIPSFITKLRQRQGVAASALEFCILTAARSGEVLGAHRQEFDLDAAMWTVPAERMKGGKEHRVPLSVPALQIIKAMMAENTGSAFIFPGGNTGEPLTATALHRALRRMGIADATPHGFRSGFRDWAADCTHTANEVCEAALAHTIENRVEAAYRRSDLFEKRRNLMNAWGRFCTNVGAAEVVPLRITKRI
jgi:integrase